MRVLVANRGEIARRILRTLRVLGIESVAVHSEADRDAPYLREAKRAVEIGPAPPADSYLSIDRILAAGRATGVNAVHPGYGFLSENPTFAAAVEAEGWTFIGPTPDSIRAMGDKTVAQATARKARVPTIPSFAPGPGEGTPKRLLGAARKLGMPLMLKAAAGGGGKGMRIAHRPEELEEMIPAAMRESKGAFGDARIYLERYIEGARHVEVQVLGDGAGGALSLGERDCSIQRRHQKLIEESPAPRLDDRKREELAQSARRLIEKSRYRGAGTVEFILAPDGAFYFLEMNTRLQVEHPVTEMIYGIDLVALQVAIARGQGWPSALAEARPRGHAIEARIYAESPAAGFLPSTGVLAEAAWPEGPGVRVDAGVERGSEVGVHYDPLLGKIIAHGGSRDEALERLRAALAETFLAGIDTTVGFSRDLLDSAGFRDGQVHTTFIEERMKDWSPPPAEDGWEAALNAAALQLFEQGAAGGNSGGSAGKGPPAVWEALGGWRMDR